MATKKRGVYEVTILGGNAIIVLASTLESAVAAGREVAHRDYRDDRVTGVGEIANADEIEEGK